MNNPDTKKIIEQLKNGKLETPIIMHLDLSGENLNGIKIKESMFDYINFDNVNLAGAEFEGCFFTGCSFRGAVLDNAHFFQSSIGRGFLPKASEGDFDIALDAVDLPDEQKQTLRQAGITGFKYQPATFTQASMKNVRLDALSLDQVSFESCDLSGAQFSSLEITESNFTLANSVGDQFHKRTI
jgi:uncharacterized protein YjbI with pentapeptide repeats